MADYVIQRGDTLGAIAARLGTTVQALARANGIANPDMIRAGATLQVPDAPGQAPQRPAGAPAPTTGAMPVPRPQQVAAMDPMAAPIPPPNPSRPPPPLPPQNPTRPGVAGPPMDRGAPMTTGGGPAGYQPAGWTPVPAAGPVPTTQQWAANRPPTGSIGQGGDQAFEDIYGGGAAQPAPQASPAAPAMPPAAPADMWQGAQGDGYQRHRTLSRNDIPDPAGLSYQQMMEFESRWLSAGRKLDELGPQWDQAHYIRRQQFDIQRAEAERVNRQAMDQAAADRRRFGTDMRVADPAPPVDASIGEGQYLPQEMIQLGQLGANMRNAPRAQTMLPSLGLLSGPRRTQPTLGQLAYTGV